MYHNDYQVLEEYNSIEDLKIILKIAIEEEQVCTICDTLLKFPKEDKFDSLKKILLERYKNEFDSIETQYIICSIVNDELKLKLLQDYKDILSRDYIKAEKDKNFPICQVINSLENDVLKVKTFHDNIELYDSPNFSDYLRRIKSSKLRSHEFLLHKKQFPDFNIWWICSSYSSDTIKCYLFDKYYDESKKEQISSFISDLQSDKLQLEYLKRYSDCLESIDFEMIGKEFESENNIDYILENYANKLESDVIKVIIQKIPNETKKLQKLDNVYHLMETIDIIDIITKIKDNKLEMKTFKKYLESFDQDAKVSLYLKVYCNDKKSGQNFITQFNNYFDSKSLYSICSLHIEFKEYDMLEWILNNYIFLFDKTDLYAMVSMIKEKENSTRIEDLIQKC